MKWPTALLKPTKQYTGGIVAGIGVGVLLFEMIQRRISAEIPYSVILVVGFVLIVIGSTLARSGQRKLQEPEETSEQDAPADADKPLR